MKRLLTIATCVLVLWGVALAEAPAPFEKAKDMPLAQHQTVMELSSCN